jgi:hypothetical protein
MATAINQLVNGFVLKKCAQLEPILRYQEIVSMSIIPLVSTFECGSERL